MDFAISAKSEFEIELSNYDEIHSWSIKSPIQFWSHAAKYLGLIGTIDKEVYEQGEHLSDCTFFPSTT